MMENSKLQPAKLGKNFDPVDHSNRNFSFLSFYLYCYTG